MRNQRIRKVGPEYPGEGAIKHFIAGSTSAEYSRNTQKNEKIMNVLL